MPWVRDLEQCLPLPERRRASRCWKAEALLPKTTSPPIFPRATMPQVQSPDTGEGLGGRGIVTIPGQMALRVDRVGVTLNDGRAVVKRREQAAAFPLAARPVGSGHGRRLRYRPRDAPGFRAAVGDPGGVAV